MSTDDAEYQKLYKLLSSLSSKTAPQSNHIITPMISLEEGKTSRTLTLDIPPVRSPTPPHNHLVLYPYRVFEVPPYI